MKKYLFLDRDGTLVQEPESQQIDTIAQVAFLPSVIPVLLSLKKAGFSFIIVSNQDGLGSAQYSMSSFDTVQNFISKIFKSQGIEFDDVLICPHQEQDRCFCRKPQIGLLLDYVKDVTWDRSNSYVIGDRDSDLQLAQNIGIQGIKLSQSDPAAWLTVQETLLVKSRMATVTRNTSETQIKCFVNIDQEGDSEINTGIYFFDHMLEQFAKHAGITLKLDVRGDLQVDQHHTIEDAAIVLGKALRKSLGDKQGIARYGFLLPMDESLAQVALDLGGRSFLEFDAAFPQQQVGEFPVDMVKHFFRSFSEQLKAVTHIKVTGENSHHMIEAIFKAVGRGFRMAKNKISDTLPTTKGVL